MVLNVYDWKSIYERFEHRHSVWMQGVKNSDLFLLSLSLFIFFDESNRIQVWF